MCNNETTIFYFNAKYIFTGINSMFFILFCIINHIFLVNLFKLIYSIKPLEYYDNNPIYLIGREIERNIPYIDVIGYYEIYPYLNNGLKFDRFTGILSGIPYNKYNEIHKIKFIEFKNNEIYECEMKIICQYNITKFNYGIDNITSSLPINLNITPIVDYLPLLY